jgi:hypothetical protein
VDEIIKAIDEVVFLSADRLAVVFAMQEEAFDIDL